MNGEQLRQLTRYDLLIQSKEINKIEYVFSTKASAEANLPIFKKVFARNIDDFDLIYIENGVRKLINKNI